ncbi:conserved protein [Tepidicaulis marinus]|jgi:hypothetical protein|uniref:Conserved protein n=1 Tax=Tepidicaulis marinus TaxID=1333998 RepID=A0A081B678_9HYPH|nr:hypothetical protein [Tepidicaulis marinus]GAK43546.1 conserved protein [Tepidicaulis marinus]
MTNKPIADALKDRLSAAAKKVTGRKPEGPALSADSQLARLVSQIAPGQKGPRSWQAGNIQILGLESLRRQLGPTWDKFASTIHLAIENILSQQLGVKDVYARLGDERYIVIFASNDPRHAAEVMAKVTDHLMANLLGESGTELLQVETVLGQVNASADGDIQFSEHKEEKDPDAGLILPDIGPSNYESVYAPIWNARHQVLSGYAYIPYEKRQNGRERFEHAVLPPDRTSADTLALDLEHLNQAIETMNELYVNKFALQLITQVHYDSLETSAGREKVMAVCRQIPNHLRKFLLLQIVGLPEHTPMTTFMQRVSPLKPFFGFLAVRAPSFASNLRYFRDLSVSTVTYRIPENADQEKILARVEQLVKEAETARILLSIEYVPTIDLAKKLKELGVWFITGKAIGEVQDFPRNMRRCTLDELAADRFV